ncbi:MAG: hypothetical protein GC184_12655 [Rhizobiales bacterium]|nr:hypothetical protein [Hyphomicrobiales bacterium]
MASRFILYRIIGNALPLRHGASDTLDHLAYILKEEPDLPGCEKRWILNHFVDDDYQAQCIELIEAAGYSYHIIPFDRTAFGQVFLDPTGLPPDIHPYEWTQSFIGTPKQLRALEWITRHKSQLLIHPNKARNLALDIGLKEAEWVLPLDGSCFFTAPTWQAFVDAIDEHPDALYAILPLIRLSDAVDSTGDISSYRTEEPQVAFHRDAPDRFDMRLRYGNRNKAEFLVRLDVPGDWLEWQPALWDNVPPLEIKAPGRYVMAAPVFRLKPGADPETESNSEHRYTSRFFGLRQQIAQIEAQLLKSHLSSQDRGPSLHISEETKAWLEAESTDILKKPIPLITDKTMIPPSGNRQDYFSHMRYLHKIGDLYLKKDGVTNPAAVIGTPESRAYDRTAFYECLHHAMGLALSGKALKRADHLQAAADILDKWFVAADTRMNPHGRYAQLNFQMSRKLDYPGLIDFRDLWILPLICEILESENALSEGQQAAIRDWMRHFHQYLIQSDQGKAGITAKNNISTWLHLLRMSFALYAGEVDMASLLIRESSLRFGQQCGKLGWQNEEMLRPLALHYSLFNATAWVLIAGLMRRTKNDFWQFEGVHGESVCQLLFFIQNNLQGFPDYAARKDFHDYWLSNLISLVPDDAIGQARLVRAERDGPRLANDPNTGLPPFWFCYLPLDA